MTRPDERSSDLPADLPTPPSAPVQADAPAPDEHEEAHPPHPPFARSSDDYTDPPGHHRRGPNGPALDVGA